MKKNQHRWKATHTSEPHTHVIQARITPTSEKHVCPCGADAHFCLTSYEVTTQDQADRFYQEVKTHLKHGPMSIHEMMEPARSSTVADEIYDATVQEQHHRGIYEHNWAYECFSCLATLLTQEAGKPCGEMLLMQLLHHPLVNAIFVARRVSEPTRAILTIARFDTPDRVRAFLEHDDTPTIDVISLEPEDKQ